MAGKQYCKCNMVKQRRRVKETIQHYQRSCLTFFVCWRNKTSICSGHSEDAKRRGSSVKYAWFNGRMCSHPSRYSFDTTHRDKAKTLWSILTHRALCKEIKIESKVPHLKPESIACGEEIFACIFMPNQTPIWFGFFFLSASRFLSVWSRGEWERDLKMGMMCVICHNSNFRREEKRLLRKCNFQRSITISRERTWLFKEFQKMTRFS